MKDDEDQQAEATEQLSDDGLQHPLVHEGGGSSPNYDTNEAADSKVEVLQPSGDQAPSAEEDPDR